MFLRILLVLLLQTALRAQDDSLQPTANVTLPGNDTESYQPFTIENSTSSLNNNSTIANTVDQIDPTTLVNGTDSDTTARRRRHEGNHGKKRKHFKRRRHFHTREWKHHLSNATEESESVWDTIKHAGMDERASNNSQSSIDNSSTILSIDLTNSTTTQSNSTQILEPTDPTDSKSIGFDASSDSTFNNSTQNALGNSTSDSSDPQ